MVTFPFRGVIVGASHPPIMKFLCRVRNLLVFCTSLSRLEPRLWVGGVSREAIYVTPNYYSAKNTKFSAFCLIFSVGKQIADPVVNGLETICCLGQKCSCWWWPLVNTVTRTRLCLSLDGWKDYQPRVGSAGADLPDTRSLGRAGDATVASTTWPGLPFTNASTP